MRLRSTVTDREPVKAANAGDNRAPIEAGEAFGLGA
jgi:hypothetical protein